MFECHIMAEKHLNFLEDCLPELLEDVPLEVKRRIWFQHRGAPLFFARYVRHFFK
jgi:hypothetical protein